MSSFPDAISAIQDAISRPWQPIPTQVIVTYNDKHKAYGRDGLKAMTYTDAFNLFLRDLGTVKKNGSPIRGAQSDVAASVTKYHLFAIFYRRHRDGDVKRVAVDGGTWSELVGNVTKIEIADRPPEGWTCMEILSVLIFFVVAASVIVAQKAL